MVNAKKIISSYQQDLLTEKKIKWLQSIHASGHVKASYLMEFEAVQLMAACRAYHSCNFSKSPLEFVPAVG